MTPASARVSASGDLLKIGLIGCGGRGTGAVGNAFAADSNCRLVAMADAFPDSVQNSMAQLKKQAPERVAVEPDETELADDRPAQHLDGARVYFFLSQSNGHKTKKPTVPALPR